MRSILIVNAFILSIFCSCNRDGVRDDTTNSEKEAVKKFLFSKYRANKPVTMSVNPRHGYTSIIITYAPDSAVFKTFSSCYITNIDEYVLSVSFHNCLSGSNLIENTIFSENECNGNNCVGHVYNIEQDDDFISFRVTGRAKVVENKLIFEK